MTGNSGTCSALFDVDSVASLSTTSDWTATLSGWSGADSFSGDPVNVTMSTDKGVTATFGTAMNARIQLDPLTPYGRISYAYTAAALGATIEARNIIFSEAPTFERAGKTYNLYSGFVGTGLGQPGTGDYSTV